MAILYEHYIIGDTANLGRYAQFWAAQTFKPLQAHKITSVKFKLFRTGLPGILDVSIKATDDDGHPTGIDLCSGTIDGDTLTTDFPGIYYEITLGAGYDLLVDTKYAIVIRALSGDSSNVFQIRYASPGTYPRGNLEISSDSGTSWTTGAAFDFMFEDWGQAPGEAPSVTTQAVSDIAPTTATGNGTITSDGGELCSKRGVCWNITGNPTVADDKSEETDSFGVGAFTRPITGLSPNTHYFVKAYAYNSFGYGYGNQVEFDTLPPPLIQRWALKDILIEATETGVLLTAYTFHPCHLYMRWTHTEPEEHLISRISRGLPLISDKRFCFVTYQDNEQEEGGDTYTHTFLKEPWELCETRWFYFHGTVEEQSSPSTSAIFKHHKCEATLTVYATDSTDLHGSARLIALKENYPDYDEVWLPIIATGVTTSLRVGQDYRKTHILPDKYTWRLNRQPLIFDTTSLPPNCTVVEATLTLWTGVKGNSIDFDIIIQNGQPTFPHDPVIASDYNKDLYSGNGGSVNTSSIAYGAAGSLDIPLNITGRGWIRKGLYTKLLLRTHFDINHIDSNCGDFSFYTDTSLPRLVVKYKVKETS